MLFCTNRTLPPPSKNSSKRQEFSTRRGPDATRDTKPCWANAGPGPGLYHPNSDGLQPKREPFATHSGRTAGTLKRDVTGISVGQGQLGLIVGGTNTMFRPLGYPTHYPTLLSKMLKDKVI